MGGDEWNFCFRATLLSSRSLFVLWQSFGIASRLGLLARLLQSFFIFTRLSGMSVPTAQAIFRILLCSCSECSVRLRMFTEWFGAFLVGHVRITTKFRIDSLAAVNPVEGGGGQHGTFAYFSLGLKFGVQSSINPGA